MADSNSAASRCFCDRPPHQLASQWIIVRHAIFASVKNVLIEEKCSKTCLTMTGLIDNYGIFMLFYSFVTTFYCFCAANRFLKILADDDAVALYTFLMNKLCLQ